MNLLFEDSCKVLGKSKFLINVLQSGFLSVLSYFSTCGLRKSDFHILVFLRLSDAVEESTSESLTQHRKIKFAIVH